jgi:hypothetical protein
MEEEEPVGGEDSGTGVQLTAPPADRLDHLGSPTPCFANGPVRGSAIGHHHPDGCPDLPEVVQQKWEMTLLVQRGYHHAQVE